MFFRPKLLVLSAILSLAGFSCSESNGENPADVADTGVEEQDTGIDAPEAGVPDSTILNYDGGIIIRHDAGAPRACNTTCDCPQGLACLDGICSTAGVGPVWCCDNEGCPSGQPCLDQNETPGTCPLAPDAGPDAGPRDIGAGVIGAGCEMDNDCDTSMGLSCWTRQEINFMWGGYCTLENCTPGCPANSSCININMRNQTCTSDRDCMTGERCQNNQCFRIGCMGSCTTDLDCRSDAHCFAIPNSPIRICIPNCGDDIFDCSPRNGTTYCSRTTGVCEQTPMQTLGARVGDPCVDNRSCGEGQVCMGERGWGLPGGHCTRICSGLAESTPCAPDETCQTFAGIGMCFRNCDSSGQCMNRPGAICGRLDSTWATPSCIPQ